MEFFNKDKVIRLCSPTNKYLTADKDEETVRQSSNSSSHLARWTVEFDHSYTHLIRLKSVHGLYLTITEESVLLGGSGARKVIQAKFNSRALIDNPTVQWEPIKEGVYVKLRCKAGGMFLKGNGGWRNTVTCDLQQSDRWVLWGVEVVDEGLVHSAASSSHLSTTVSRDLIISNATAEPTVPDGTRSLMKFSSLSPIRALRRKQRGSSMDMDSTSPSMAARATFMFAKTFKGSSKALGETSSPEKLTSSSSFSMRNAFKRKDHHSLRETSSLNSLLLPESSSSESNLELFSIAKTVRLRSQHKKYLLANEDEENVKQGRRGSSKSARWNVEFVEGTSMIRLRSCYKKYLTATEDTIFMFGMTGKKVMQTSPHKLDSSVEWEPFREGMQVKLKTRYGNFLCANGGHSFWKNTVTHGLPQRTAAPDWILWDVEILEIIPKENVESENEDEEPQLQLSEYESEKTPSRTNSTASENNDLPYSSESESEVPLPSHSSPKFQTSRSFQNEGRLIYYNVVKNEVEDMNEGSSIHFKGNGLEALKEILAEKSGMENFTLCSRNALNGQLYPIKLQLPPNKASMHVFLVPS